MAGSGDFVTVGEDNVSYSGAGWVSGENILLEKFQQSMSMAATYDEKVQGYIDAMGSLLDNYQLPDNWESIFDDVNLGEIPGFGNLVVPSVGDLDLNEDWVNNFPLAPILREPPNPDFSYTPPDEPADVDPSINYVEAPYDSSIWEPLFDRVYNDLVNGGTGLEPDVEQAIFDRTRERQRQTNAREWQRAIDGVSSQGFDFAGGAESGLLVAISNEIHQQDTNINNDVMIEQARLAQNNTQFAVTTATRMDELLRQFHNQVQNRDLEAQVRMAGFVLQKFSEKWRGYIAQWEGIKTELEAKRDEIQVVIAYNDSLIKAYLGEIDGIKSRNDAIASENNAKVEAFRGEVAAFDAEVRERSSVRQDIVERERLKIQQADLELRKATEELKATLENSISTNELRQKILDAMSGISANVLAASLNAINASVSHATQSAKGISESWSHSDSITETHYYEEDVV